MCLPSSSARFFSDLCSRQRLRFSFTSRSPTVIWVGRNDRIGTGWRIGSRVLAMVCPSAYSSCPAGEIALDGVYYALMVRSLKWPRPGLGGRHTRLPEGLTPWAFDRRSRFHETLRGWMAAPHPARFDVGSAAAVL